MRLTEKKSAAGVQNEVEFSSNSENWENANQDNLSQVIPLLGIYLMEIIRDKLKDLCASMFIWSYIEKMETNA